MTRGMEAVRVLHLIAMAFFVGGQLLLAVAVVPALRDETSRDRLRAVARRFGFGTLIAIAVLIGTGIPMASHFHQWDTGTLHAKLALVAAVAALVVAACTSAVPTTSPNGRTRGQRRSDRPSRAMRSRCQSPRSR